MTVSVNVKTKYSKVRSDFKTLVIFLYRQLGCLALSLRFWPKIKQLLSNCPAWEMAKEATQPYFLWYDKQLVIFENTVFQQNPMSFNEENGKKTFWPILGMFGLFLAQTFFFENLLLYPLRNEFIIWHSLVPAGIHRYWHPIFPPQISNFTSNWASSIYSG